MYRAYIYICCVIVICFMFHHEVGCLVLGFDFLFVWTWSHVSVARYTDLSRVQILKIRLLLLTLLTELRYCVFYYQIILVVSFFPYMKQQCYLTSKHHLLLKGLVAWVLLWCLKRKQHKKVLPKWQNGWSPRLNFLKKRKLNPCLIIYP